MVPLASKKEAFTVSLAFRWRNDRFFQRGDDGLWERALPAKGSEAPGRIPETHFFSYSALHVSDAVQWFWFSPSGDAGLCYALPGTP